MPHWGTHPDRLPHWFCRPSRWFCRPQLLILYTTPCTCTNRLRTISKPPRSTPWHKGQTDSFLNHLIHRMLRSWHKGQTDTFLKPLIHRIIQTFSYYHLILSSQLPLHITSSITSSQLSPYTFHLFTVCLSSCLPSYILSYSTIYHLTPHHISSLYTHLSLLLSVCPYCLLHFTLLLLLPKVLIEKGCDKIQGMVYSHRYLGSLLVHFGDPSARHTSCKVLCSNSLLTVVAVQTLILLE